MVEIVDNIIQIILSGFCTFYSLYRAVNSGKREWSLLGLFSGAFFLGDLYYILFLILYSGTSFDSNIPYLCWYTSYLFLILLILHIKDKRPAEWPPMKMFLIPVFTALMCLLFVIKGDVISNVVSFALMTVLMWNAADGLRIMNSEGNTQDPRRWIYILTMAFCFIEYALWTASFFWIGDSLANPFFWFDIMISLCFVAFVIVFRKAVDQ